MANRIDWTIADLKYSSMQVDFTIQQGIDWTIADLR